MTIHAHPDDEASKGAGTVAKYHAEGVRTVLVCCTGGEAGEVLNPALDTPENWRDLAEIRLRELEASAHIIGYDHVELLGYRDSGMAGTPENQDPRCFARADQTEAVGRLVAIIRRHRPDVVVTYGDDQEVYPHPDHLRVHDVTVAAVEAAAERSTYVGLGESWQVSKLYYSVSSIAKLRLLHDALLQIGFESPFPLHMHEMTHADERITTRIDVTDWLTVRAAALRAHATQIEPDSPLWFGVDDELHRRVSGEDDYILAVSTVEVNVPETDLLSGLRGNDG